MRPEGVLAGHLMDRSGFWAFLMDCGDTPNLL